MRHEDFALEMEEEARKIFDFMNLDLQERTKEFIHQATHPDPEAELVHNVHVRDPKTVVTYWKTKLTMKEVREIQDSCQEAMALWGYLPVRKLDGKDLPFKYKFNPFQ